MSVYVDPLFATAPMRYWPYARACHLFADSLVELHAFAAKIGLKRKWFQAHANFPHYDLTTGKRGRAVAACALELTRQEAAEKMRTIKGAEPPEPTPPPIEERSEASVR